MKQIALITAALAASAALVAVAAPEGQRHGAMAERIKQADTNGDGMISKEEAKALPRLLEHFDQIDANKDGLVSAEELRAFRKSMHGEGMKHRGAFFKKIDTDGDGRISLAEAQAGAPRLAAHFEEIDANKDGFLTHEELKAAHKHGPK